MARLSILQTTILVILSFILGHFTHAQSLSDMGGFAEMIHHYPGYSAQLSFEFCKANFPYHKIIPRPVTVSNQSQSFGLFAFTVFPFDSKKPSIVTIHGGPGGLWAPSSAQEISRELPKFNVIFFHYRGGGCSDFRTNSSSWDTLLNSDGVISDLEAIRKEYGIASWQGVLGFSYGTNIARRYSHQFPDLTGILILEGLNDPYNSNELSVAIQIKKLISSIENRFQTSKSLSVFAEAKALQKRFTDILRDYFSQVDPTTNFAYAAAWNEINSQFKELYRKSGQPIPKYISLPTFQSVSLLIYSGEEDESDVAILILLDQFGLISLDTETKNSLNSYLSTWDKVMFPFKYKNYVENFSSGLLLSWRVHLKMTENDNNLPQDSICTSRPMIVLNGTKDLATPIENVEAYLKNKSCAKASNVGLSIVGGGHSNFGSLKCLSEYVDRSLLAKQTDVPKPEGCLMPITLKFY